MSSIFPKNTCPNCDCACVKPTKFRQCEICQQKFHKACYDRRVTINSNDPFICYLCRWGLAAASPVAAPAVAASPVAAPAAAASPVAAPAAAVTAAAPPPPPRPRRRSPPSRSPSPTVPPRLSPVQRHYRFFE
ncbi:hypothetical protein G6F42_009396 [Rhizopus arrhizus]|nr:hypothetical protein G6F42_009396 [Rhizopus arrhizus]